MLRARDVRQQIGHRGLAAKTYRQPRLKITVTVVETVLRIVVVS